MKQYIKLLKNEYVLRRLSTIQLISYFGAWFSNVAIYTLLIEMDVSAGVIALVAALHFLPGVLQAPVSGTFIDRLAPKKLMLWLLSIEIVSTLSLLMVQDISLLWLLYIIIFIRMGAASFYFTAEMSLLPRILHHDHLKQANEIHSVIWSFSYTVGMAVSGFVVYALGVKAAFVLDALLFFIGFLLLFNVKIDVIVTQSGESVIRMMKKTFTYLKENKHVLHLMFVHSLVGLTSFDAVVALMVDRYYSAVIATSLALGLMHSSRAVGLVFGPVFLGKWINDKRLLYLFLFQGIALFVWSYVMEYFYLSLLASVFVGFFTTTLWSYSYTLIQHKTDKEYYGRIVAYNDMIFLTVASVTSLLTGELAKIGFSLQSIVAYMAAAFFMSSIYYAWIYKRYIRG
ncbi:MFS transporter [Sulfurimonas sp. HSL-1716]|uniref:MFS transporter n=1 Tax=Hydrocurvibacter sulfurireducens TaxID=3131937 RepID=UPI0031F8B50F